ncbi:MAG: hypothetical protein A2293_10950 [Elusimicrobia bacterium RIFOXYB2_FULL_49_7]|nr:MAG: hypothetical protein A2293_10950 [Elusimicrobia bacterium RIFOXYB2_FULL_49_7]
MRLFVSILFLFCFVLSLAAFEAVRNEIGIPYYEQQGYHGAGVILGVVDDVDITLNDFRDPATGHTRIIAYKRYYLNEQGVGQWDIWDSVRIDSLLAADYTYNQYHDFDTTTLFHHRKNDHGTIIAGIMGGNGTTLQADGITQTGVMGVCPASRFIIVSRPYDSSLYFIDSIAQRYGLPWSSNISWTIGPENEVKMLTGVGKPGKVVVAAAGNNNFKNTRKIVFAPGDTLKSLTFDPTPLDSHIVGTIGHTTYYFYMTSFNLVYTGGHAFKTQFRTQYAEKKEFAFTDSMTGDSSWYLRGDATASTFEEFKVRKYHITHQQFDFYIQAPRTGNWYVDFIKGADPIEPETLELSFTWKVDNYQPYGEVALGTNDISRHTMVDFALLDELITVGGNVHGIIDGSRDTVGDICYYSGVGPSFNDRIKPDLVAPAHGMDVLAVHNLSSMVSLVFFGTSFSAPLAAGAAALLLEEDSTRDAAQIKAILTERAVANEFSGTLPNEVWGYGILNLDPSKTDQERMTVPRVSAPLFFAQPNPFNPETVFRFSLEQVRAGERLKGCLRVFNVQGALVADISKSFRQGALRSGQGTVRWDASGLASGVYFAELVLPSRRLSTRLLYLR